MMNNKIASLGLTLISAWMGMASAEEISPTAPTPTAVESTPDIISPAPVTSGDVVLPAVPAIAPRTPAPAPTNNEVLDNSRIIRVPYLTETVKNEIRDQIRAELRADVLQDVLTQAKDQRWGVPGVLPEWIDRIRVKGDMRVREQSEFYDRDNASFGYYDYLTINRSGGGLAFISTQEERHRLRERVRLGIDARVNNEVKAIMQLSTGSLTDPVSTNQTLGNTGQRSAVGFDLAYVQIDDEDADHYPWLTLQLGRMKNPWLSTDLVWDADLAFDGIVATYRKNLRGSDSLMEMSDRDRTLFVTVGAFPIQEVALSQRDKWLFGAQVGSELIFTSQSKLTFGLAYYDYVHIAGRMNDSQNSSNLLQTNTDYTAPDFMQKGNTLFDIRDDTSERWALASDYNLIDFTLVYDLARFAPYHLVMTGDYVRNIGYKTNEIRRRTNDATTNEIKARNKGYQAQLAFGWPLVMERGTWRVSYAYKYLERDAVLDAFTDSDFHLGGTDAKGWILSGEYGLYENTWLTARWISADAIDGPPFGVDVLQLDFNVRF
ncbi:MAG: putative porin [Gammaproteobacteria bacterium]|nr:putative porin [Gammaproteobacteria bacterium]